MTSRRWSIAVIAILAALTMATASVVVYLAIGWDPAQAGRLGKIRGVLPLAAIANGVLLLVIWRLAAGDSRRQGQSVDALKARKVELEQQVVAHAEELRNTIERLRSVIDSAVDGIVVLD